jgi:NAD(P)H-dependent flavin oxidoreductase YrpB (nitropropane dioxygenase family)
MIGIGSTESVEFLGREAAIARGTDQGRFGIGMHTWAIERRPDLFDAAIEAKPFLISISFGSVASYVERLHQHGILLAAQVNTRAEAIQAERDGVDLIVAQGLAWPPQYPGRALRNRFTDQWHSHIEALPQNNEARQQLAEAIAAKNYDLAYIYAGEAVGLVTRQQSAGEVIRYLGEGAERLLRDRSTWLLEGHGVSRKE